MAELAWPREGLTRVPYAFYSDAGLYVRERQHLVMGATWNFLCLEIEIPNPGDYRATFVGDVPVTVARDCDGSLGAFENRCAHRAALL
jgi:anthranilate 1,2-dioxygenase large subunit